MKIAHSPAPGAPGEEKRRRDSTEARRSQVRRLGTRSRITVSHLGKLDALCVTPEFDQNGLDVAGSYIVEPAGDGDPSPSQI